MMLCGTEKTPQRAFISGFLGRKRKFQSFAFQLDRIHLNSRVAKENPHGRVKNFTDFSKKYEKFCQETL